MRGIRRTAARTRTGTAMPGGASLAVVLLVATMADAQLAERALETCAAGEPTTITGLPDGDADGIADAIDNCLDESNPDQRDTDGDTFGNACDADLDNNGIVNPLDLGILKAAFFDSAPGLDADLDGDGVVAPGDLAIMRRYFFAPPGPVGACRAEPATCAGPADFEFDDVGEVTNGNLFVFRTSDPATIHHARRLIAASSECNPNISGETFLGTRSWNPDWGFHIDGTIRFHGNTVEPVEGCDRTAAFIEANLASWCGVDEAIECQFWCPWRSRLTRELKAQ